VIETELYKRIDGDWHYWRAGCHGESVAVHAGKVGAAGEVREISPASDETPAALLIRETGQARAQGYTEFDPEDLVHLVVQYQIDGMGSVDDLDQRQRVEEVLGECLASTGNGYCDGGDIGSGTMNVFCYVVVPKLAIESVRTALESEEFIAGATIAVRNEDGETYDVAWPVRFDGEFALL
jgi:hypothetical protein